MRRSLILVALSVCVSLAFGSQLSFAQRRAVHMDPAFEVFPGTVYDTPFTHTYAAAFGSVTVPGGQGANPACVINAHGLQPGFLYTVYVDLNGSLAGDVSTAGPWQLIGEFVADAEGDGHFKCSSALPVALGAAQVSIYVNDQSVGLTILIGGNVAP